MLAKPRTHRPRLEVKEVKERARGHWIGILSALAGDDLGPAIEKRGRHVPCPRHDSPDGFRLFKDAPDTGGGICSTCGEFANGIDLLMWLHGWSFPEALRAVARELGMEVDGQTPAPRPVARKVVEIRPKRDPAILDRSIRRVWDEAVELTAPGRRPWSSTSSSGGYGNVAVWMCGSSAAGKSSPTQVCRTTRTANSRPTTRP